MNWSQSITLLGLGLLSTGLSTLAVHGAPQQICTYDPSLGQPNPLGMRAYLTITAEANTITFLYEQFPSNVGDGSVPITLSSERTLTFYETDLDQARQILLNSPGLYSDLVGYEDPEGFGPLNALITCQAPQN